MLMLQKPLRGRVEDGCNIFSTFHNLSKNTVIFSLNQIIFYQFNKCFLTEDQFIE